MAMRLHVWTTQLSYLRETCLTDLERMLQTDFFRQEK